MRCSLVTLVRLVRLVTLSAVVGVVGVLGAARPAAAQAGGAADEPPIYFGTATRGGVDPTMVTHFKASIEKALAHQGIKILDASGTSEDSAAVAESDARKSFDEATQAYGDGDWSTVEADTARALQSFEEGPAFSPDDQAWALYRDIVSLRALGFLKQKKNKEAGDTVRQLLVVLPRYAPNREKAPPELIRRVDDVKDEIRSLPPATLQVNSKPSGAAVVVDGKKRGRTPLQMDDLAPGVHYVAVDGPTGHFTQRVVLGDAGFSVNAKLGSKKGTRARDVVRALEKPTAAKDFVEAITGVDENALVMVLLPVGKKKVEVLGAKVAEGELKLVIAVESDDNESNREKATYALVDALLTQSVDAYLLDAAKRKDADPKQLRPTLFNAVSIAEEEPPPEPLSPAVLASGIVGSIVVAALVSVGVGAIIYGEVRKNEGFTFTVQSSLPKN